MPRARNKNNKGYPTGWRWKNGAIRYRVPPGMEAHWDGKKEFTLGKNETEAYKTWSEHLLLRENTRTTGDLLERYLIEVVPEKAFKTQESNRISISRLLKVFSEIPVGQIEPVHAYKYMDIVSKKHGNASANRDLEVLSHAHSKAVEWGLIRLNPIKGQVKKKKVPRRERYVEDWELDEAIKAASPTLRAYIIFKLLTGLRRGDILKLTLDALKEDGIHITPSKTVHSSGQKLIISWSDELEEVVEKAYEAQRIKSKHLFCTGIGEPFIKENGSCNAFDSLWRRFMKKALSETKLKVRFQEKDLRKKTASDMDLDTARALLGHTDVQTTKRHYRIKGDIVKPHTLKR